MENRIIIESHISDSIKLDELRELDGKEVLSTAEKKEQEKVDKLVLNYKNIIKVNIEILRNLLEKGRLKPVALYHFGFILELSVKMILLEYGMANIIETTNFKHRITGLFEKINNSSNDERIKQIFLDIEAKKQLIHTDGGKVIDYDNYAAFKYNNNINDTNLIIKNPMGKKEIIAIEEAIKCVEKIL